MKGVVILHLLLLWKEGPDTTSSLLSYVPFSRIYDIFRDCLRVIKKDKKRTLNSLWNIRDLHKKTEVRRTERDRYEEDRRGRHEIPSVLSRHQFLPSRPTGPKLRTEEETDLLTYWVPFGVVESLEGTERGQIGQILPIFLTWIEYLTTLLIYSIKHLSRIMTRTTHELFTDDTTKNKRDHPSLDGKNSSSWWLFSGVRVKNVRRNRGVSPLPI